jgi:hypothetical protein
VTADTPKGPGEPEDPFAFDPDRRDRPGGGADREPEAHDPFAFGPDDQDDPDPRTGRSAADRDGATDDPADGAGPADGPPSRRRRRRERRAARTDEENETIRTVADEASRRAQAIGVRWLAVAGIVLVLLAGVSTLTGRGGEQGGDVQAGETLPPFAAPLATRPELKGQDDVNVADGDGQGERGRRAACSITSSSAITSCALLRRGPLVLVIFSRGIDACVSAVDELDRVRGRYPGLQTLAVATLGRHGPTAETVASRRWTLPVAYDRDAGLSTLLGAPACPLVLFVRQDGTIAQRIIGEVSTAALTRGIDALLRPATPGTTTAVDGAAPGR